jgi:hypothetical protein
LKLESLPVYSFREQFSNIFDFAKTGNYRVADTDATQSDLSRERNTLSPFLIRVGSWLFGKMENSIDSMDEKLRYYNPSSSQTMSSLASLTNDRDIEEGSSVQQSLHGNADDSHYPHSRFSTYPGDSDESDICEHYHVGEDEDHFLIRSRR